MSGHTFETSAGATPTARITPKLSQAINEIGDVADWAARMGYLDIYERLNQAIVGLVQLEAEEHERQERATHQASP